MSRPSSGKTGKGRVVESHHIARSAFVAALAFALVAAGWAGYVLVVGGSWWGPLHSFLAGTVLLAISGASQLFTITWSSTTPPARASVVTQRWLVIAGVATVLVGVHYGIPGLVWIGGAGTVAGVLLLARMIYAAIRKSLLRRFDLSARFYLTAFGAGAVGIGLGTLMGAGAAPGRFADIRLVHAHLNLVGLVGLTIIGTIPTLLPTTAYSRAVSGREAVIAWFTALAGTASIAFGLWIPQLVGAGTVVVSVAGTLILVRIVSRLWDKGSHKVTFLQISIGTAWLLGWGLVDGIRVMSEGTMMPFSAWTAAAVIGGVGQVLVGSLAYLVPVLKGSPFETNRRILEARKWLPLVALNAGGLSLGVGLYLPAVVLLSIWAADFAVRLARVAGSRSTDDSA